jgi:hypothetical protein
MKITILKKPFGRVRKLQEVHYELSKKPETLRALLRELVAIEVARYNEPNTVMSFLTEEMKQAALIKFGTIAERNKVTVEDSIAVMELAFEDGLFKVLQGQHVYTSLDEKIISNEMQWTFMKLAFLTGR